MQENVRFDCYKCGHSFMASPQDYRTTFWYGEIVKEGYCPFCGAIIKQNNKDNQFKSSGGGKF